MKSFLVLIFCLSTITPSLRGAELIDKVLVVINNGEPILLSDRTQFRNSLESANFSDDLVIPNAEAKKRALADDSYLLDRLIDAHLIKSFIKKSDYAVTPEVVEKELSSIAKKNNIPRENLPAALERQGLKFDEYQEFIKKSMERQTFVEREIRSKIKISDDEVLAFLMKNDKNLAQSSFEYKLAQIVISTKSRSESEARKRAVTILDKMKAGQSFEELAADFSEDPDFSAGGILGVFKSFELNVPFQSAIQDLAIGGISGPVIVADKVYILKVLNKKIIPDPTLEKRKDEARAVLLSQSLRRQLDAWIEQRRQSAFIRKNP
jgi:peptidyl-prolyl cis-trans isomerase SurA